MHGASLRTVYHKRIFNVMMHQLRTPPIFYAWTLPHIFSQSPHPPKPQRGCKTDDDRCTDWTIDTRTKTWHLWFSSFKRLSHFSPALRLKSHRELWTALLDWVWKQGQDIAQRMSDLWLHFMECTYDWPTEAWNGLSLHIPSIHQGN